MKEKQTFCTPKTKHLDLGCGAAPRNPFNASELHGVDMGNRLSSEDASVHFAKANLVIDKIPYPDSYFESVSAYDFLEHIPRLIYRNESTELPFINLMNEIHRVLKNGGVFYAITPLFPRDSAFVDPTHVNFITKDTHKYFVEPHLWALMYGFNGRFSCERSEIVNFSFETMPRNGIKKYLLKLMYMVHPKLKQHVVWKLVAKK